MLPDAQGYGMAVSPSPVHAASLSRSSRRSQLAIRFQLAKFWLTSLRSLALLPRVCTVAAGCQVLAAANMLPP
jgi:hypothetical protein